VALKSASTADEIKYNHHNRNQQQNVDESAHGVGSCETQNPEDKEDDGNGVKHGISGESICFFRGAGQKGLWRKLVKTVSGVSSAPMGCTPLQINALSRSTS
jgi:hypothetical protein